MNNTNSMNVVNDAQLFYDLRVLTGYCSGTDLHEFFRQVCGNPSPCGKTVLPTAHLYMPDDMYKVLATGDTSQLIAMTAEYTSQQTADVLLLELKRNELLKDALRKTVLFYEQS